MGFLLRMKELIVLKALTIKVICAVIFEKSVNKSRKINDFIFEEGKNTKKSTSYFLH